MHPTICFETASRSVANSGSLSFVSSLYSRAQWVSAAGIDLQALIAAAWKYESFGPSLRCSRCTEYNLACTPRQKPPVKCPKGGPPLTLQDLGERRIELAAHPWQQLCKRDWTKPPGGGRPAKPRRTGKGNDSGCCSVHCNGDGIPGQAHHIFLYPAHLHYRALSDGTSGLNCPTHQTRPCLAHCSVRFPIPAMSSFHGVLRTLPKQIDISIPEQQSFVILMNLVEV